MQRDAFLQVFELRRATDFGEDREGVRIPLDQCFAERNWTTFCDLYLSAVHDCIAFALAPLFVHDRNRTLTIHNHQIACLRFHGLQVDEAHDTVALRIEPRLFRNSRCRTTDVEGTHGELGSRFADRLGRDDSGCFAEFDETSGSQVASITHDADAAFRFAGEHRANLHALDSGSLDGTCQIFGDFLVDVDDHLAFVIFDLLERNAAHDAVAQRLDDLAGFDDTGDENSVHGAAVVFADDHVLSDIDQTPRQIARVSGLESRIRQTLTGAVRRDEVFENG